MKLFQCPNCQLLLFFDNRLCTGCGYTVGYEPVQNQLHLLQAVGGEQWRTTGSAEVFRFCDNVIYDTCNWLVPMDSPERFCRACRHNRTVPDLSNHANLENWRQMEFAKHRLFYSLIRLGLPLENRADDPQHGLVFDFLAEQQGEKVLTGHEHGVITLALKEADDAEREARRTKMHEPYRTLLGHFRHEVGHYYWDVLVDRSGRNDAFRALFGDERQDYAAALKRHYEEGAPAGWQNNYISAYATSHPWEDFAESWAHYMHIIDCLETATAFGLKVHPRITQSPDHHAAPEDNPYQGGNLKEMVETWLPITYAMNAMNRSMGLSDIYPFVLSPPAIAKLGFIHEIIHA